MIHIIEVALVFMAMLSILVAAHEYGHYLFARLFKMGVEEFSIGMFGSKPLLTYGRKKYRLKLLPGEDPSIKAQSSGFSLESSNEESPSVLVETPQGPMLEESTAFTIRPWPIGGFVRIKGMIPLEDGSEVAIPGGFYSKPPWQRFIVLLAGPVFSILCGVLVMIPILLSQGVAKGDSQPILGTVLEGAASKANLRTYDKILSINSQPIRNFYDIISKVQDSPDVPLVFKYERDGKVLTTTVIPTLSPVATPILGPDLELTGEISRHAMIGVAPLVRHVKLPLGEAIFYAFKQPVIAVKGLMGIVKRPSTAKAAVGGPATMISATSDAVNEGTLEVIETAAFISISVGIFNLLPIYPLDGGQMVVALAEMLRGGRRLSMKVQNVVGAMGFATVLLLVVCVLTVDFSRFGPFQKPDAPRKIVSEPKEIH